MNVRPLRQAEKGMLVTISMAVVMVATMVVALAAADGQTRPTTCVSFPDVFINGRTAPQQTVPVSLDAGRYEVEIETSDAYAGRSAADPAGQTSERVSVLGIETADLSDGTESSNLFTYGEVELTVPITEVTATHLPSATGYDSVRVPSVCFTLIPPPPTTTTVPAPSTTVPVPETIVPAPPPETTVPVPETTVPPLVETTVPPVVETVPPPPPGPCDSYPSNFVPSYDSNGDRLNGLCQLPPGSCDPDGLIVPGELRCQYLPLNESG